jgi:uncharacterized protein (TIGR03437 family)
VVAVNNNGVVGSFLFTVTPSAPGISVDASGNVLAAGSVAPGGVATAYFTGAGDITPALRNGLAYVPSVPTSAYPVPRQPVAITVGGAQAFLQFVRQPPGFVGLMQANFIVPTSVTPGKQPVVITINGVSSPPANLQVAPIPAVVIHNQTAR